jgi:hypothetical protein
MSMPRVRNAKCACCGKTRHIVWHHFAGRLFDMLIALCAACHLEITIGLARLRIETSKKRGSLKHGCRAIVYLLWFVHDKHLERLEKGE